MGASDLTILVTTVLLKKRKCYFNHKPRNVERMHSVTPEWDKAVSLHKEKKLQAYRLRQKFH